MKKTRTGGDKASITDQREIFVNKKSARMSEFYIAHQSGFEATVVFQIYKDEYGDERVAKHEDKYYTIIRTYEKGDLIELTCERRKGLFEEVRGG